MTIVAGNAVPALSPSRSLFPEWPAFPQELAATFLGNAEILIFQRGLASAVKTVRDASRRNTSETSQSRRGKSGEFVRQLF